MLFITCFEICQHSHLYTCKESKLLVTSNDFLSLSASLLKGLYNCSQFVMSGSIVCYYILYKPQSNELALISLH